MYISVAIVVLDYSVTISLITLKSIRLSSVGSEETGLSYPIDRTGKRFALSGCPQLMQAEGLCFLSFNSCVFTKGCNLAFPFSS